MHKCPLLHQSAAGDTLGKADVQNPLASVLPQLMKLKPRQTCGLPSLSPHPIQRVVWDRLALLSMEHLRTIERLARNNL